MIIAYVLSSMSRNAGGLFSSVSSLANYIQQRGHNIQVFAGKDQFSEKDLPVWGEISINIHPQKGPRAFGYQVGLQQALKKAQIDLVHTHGLWTHTSIASHCWGKQGKPYIISPRGMLDTWALQNAQWKKRIAKLLYENNHLKNASCLHALCESEYKAIRTFGLKNPVAIIPNAVEINNTNNNNFIPEWRHSLPDHCRILLYLSRIHPKKGLGNLINAWAKFQRGKTTTPSSWHLVIAGWSECGHEEQLKKQVDIQKITDTVHFIGPQFGAAKEATFQAADAFILPSQSEGLPMAVLEAWAAELPVLMSPQCNIPEGIKADAAITIEPTSHAILNGLNTLHNLDDREINEMGSRGNQLVQTKFTWPKVADQMLFVYRWMTGNGQAPKCIRFE